MTEPDTDSPSSAIVPPRLPWRKRHPLTFGMLLGLAGSSLIGLAVLVATARTNRPPLTQAAYEEAAARWDENGPASYDLDVELGGRRPGKVHVEVRDGEVTHMTRDGVEPTQRRTLVLLDGAGPARHDRAGAGNGQGPGEVLRRVGRTRRGNVGGI